ncbi:ferric-chelate reductase Frp1 [Ophidiomyces ophidiicola]|nr:ferric-chelate reductase Frp1 [Ophidiomyces ophidiicola]
MERRHDHGGGDVAVAGVPGNPQLQRLYYAIVGAVVAAAALANLMNKIIAAQRCVETEPVGPYSDTYADNAWTRFSDRTATPSKPKSLFFKIYATLTATAREFIYAIPAGVVLGKVRLSLPPLGGLAMVLANLVVVMVLCFYKLNTLDQWSWETIGYRTGSVALAQMPLIFLLAAKTNFIAFFAGSSYERLNWLHRWTARTLWLTSTIHMCFWFRSWGRYNYILVKLKSDAISQRGLVAWCILSLIVILSIAPLRRWNYEIFVVSHILTFLGFLVAVWYHSPPGLRMWVWIPIALVVFDRVMRVVFMAIANLPLFSRRQQETPTGPRAKVGNSATFTPLPGGVTRITIQDPIVSWKPGQHVFLSCHSLLPLQSHPFTIASIPSDKRMEFIVRAEKGATKKMFSYASKNSVAKTVTIDGPYGRIRPLRQFDSVVFIAGGMGATFTMPLVRDIVEGWKTEFRDSKTSESKALSRSNFALTKRIRFVWVIRAYAQLEWFTDQLQELIRDFDDCTDINPMFGETRSLEISVYVTCDANLYPEAIRPGSSSSIGSALDQDATLTSREKQAILETIPLTPIIIPDKSTPSPFERECSCTVKITNEANHPAPCTCAGPSGERASSPISASTTDTKATSSSGAPIFSPTREPRTSVVTQRVPVLSGRPDVRAIILAVLERAEGESGVVVCGPPGLNADARRSVVSLSDERAVHKGTGAQGIYLHVEEFKF